MSRLLFSSKRFPLLIQIFVPHHLVRRSPVMTTPLVSTRLHSRETIVTGSSSGLGRAIALAFAANGVSYIICSAGLGASPEPLSPSMS